MKSDSFVGATTFSRYFGDYGESWMYRGTAELDFIRPLSQLQPPGGRPCFQCPYYTPAANLCRLQNSFSVRSHQSSPGWHFGGLGQMAREMMQPHRLGSGIER